MGQLRAVIEDRVGESGDLAAAIAAADRMARRVPGARAATVCVVLLDPADGSLTWCSAGHPPPLIAGPEGTRHLPATGHGPLGTGATYTLRHDRLEPAEVVLLYSDGIVERPGREPTAATAELARVAGDVVAGRGLYDGDLAVVDRACAQTLELLVRQTGHSDDITLLAAQRREPAPALRLGGPGALPPIGLIRGALDAWVAVLGAGEKDRLALTHAVVELVTNAVEHARPGGEVTVTVTAELNCDGEVRLTVADDGRWREHRPPRADPGRPAGRHHRSPPGGVRCCPRDEPGAARVSG